MSATDTPLWLGAILAIVLGLASLFLGRRIAGASDSVVSPPGVVAIWFIRVFRGPEAARLRERELLAPGSRRWQASSYYAVGWMIILGGALRMLGLLLR